VYRLHSDLDEPNKMDTKPSLEFNVLEMDGVVVEELKKFTKSAFDLDSTLEAASELKYSKEIKRILSQQLREPSEDFVKFFASQIYSGRVTQSVRHRFTQITKQALNQFITDRVYDRLKSAMSTEGESASKGEVTASDVTGSDGSAPDQVDSEIVTTEEEIQALYIVKAILHDVVDVKRIVMRDVRTYCGILLDDNNRKPICRLRFNGTQRYLGFLNEQRQEERVPIAHVDDIYGYDGRLKAIVGFYEQSTSYQKSEQAS